MDPNEARVYQWKEGKSRNLRALLCSLDTIIWQDSRWTVCGMHQVNISDLGKSWLESGRKNKREIHFYCIEQICFKHSTYKDLLGSFFLKGAFLPQKT